MNVNEEKEIGVIREEHELNEFQEEESSLNIIDTQINQLTPEQIEKFFKATEEGSIERLEQLFNEKINADPNMTQFTESLLMAAIRTKQNEVAEYLIDQLAINVKHEADLHEFRLRSKIPFRYRRLSCRDLAYETGMMELVDLIDINSDDVSSNIKQYLIKRLHTRLNIIHQAYLKRLEEHNKHLQFLLNEEKEKYELPTVNITDENIIPSSMLPTIQRPYKSHIEETIQNIHATNQKLIDETGKKTFRFSNYTLHFRLIDTTDTNNKTTIPSLPVIPLTTSPLTTINNNYRSIGETSTHLPIRHTRTSICRSSRRTILPQIVPIENKSRIITTTTNKRLLPKRVNQNNIKHSYIPQQQYALYNQPQRFMPVALKATTVGLPSDIRVIRN